MEAIETPDPSLSNRRITLVHYLSTFLNGSNGWGGNLVTSPARDWTKIRERMRYIVQLFRVMHLDQSVFSEPYTSEATVTRESSNANC